MNNLAASLHAGYLPTSHKARPKSQRVPTPSKRGRRHKVNAWPRVFAVLDAADRPLFAKEIVAASAVKRQCVVNALAYYADVIERTGKPYSYRYALKVAR